ncbi:MAG: hypothetical protein RIR52_1710 [Acidobacteriota bacterium]
MMPALTLQFVCQISLGAEKSLSMAICPACGSSRIRNDYRPAPIFLRAIFVRALLCDNCNRQFRAFSPRPPGNHSSGRARKKADTFVKASRPVDLESPTDGGGGQGARRAGLRDQIAQQDRTITEPTRWKTEITRVGGSSRRICPDCGSSRIRRRPRKRLERLLLSITDHRAYVCQECQSSFYARSSDQAD